MPSGTAAFVKFFTEEAPQLEESLERQLNVLRAEKGKPQKGRRQGLGPRHAPESEERRGKQVASMQVMHSVLSVLLCFLWFAECDTCYDGCGR